MFNSIQIVADYPLWFILICFLCGAIYAFALYFRSTLELSRTLLYTLTTLRFICVSVITFLLLSPYIKSLSTLVEKPIVVFAQDNSASVVINKDSIYYKEEYPKDVKELLSSLNKKFTIKSYDFGEKVDHQLSFKYNEQQTNINELFQTIDDKYVNRNVGAMILASDGIYNMGLNPLYSNVSFDFPVYTLALGDTIPPKDLKITRVLHNDIAFLDNQFPVQISVDARDCNNEKVELSIEHKGKIVYKKSISISTKDFHQKIKALIKADKKGLQEYKVKITHLNKEISYENNQFKFYINVLNSKQKILILANAPSPDIAAIKQAIETSKNYKVDVSTYSTLKKSIKPYDLIVLYQLPSKQYSTSSTKLNEILKSDKPLWFFFGAQSDVRHFNDLGTGMTYNGTGKKNNEVFGNVNNDFPVFTLSKENKAIYNDYPPIHSLFGDYKLSPGANVLFYQKIGNVNTEAPLWFFNIREGRKIAVFAGSGLWRWRIYNYKLENSTEAFDYLIKRTVQYLSLKTNQTRFRLNYEKKFEANEPIKMEAQFYNKAYQSVNDPELSIDIYNADKKKYAFVFNKSGKGYALNAGTLPKGHYSFKAKLKNDKKDFSKEGEFSIIPSQKEAMDVTANHSLLFNLSKKYDGKMYYPNQMKNLLKTLLQRKDITSVASQQTHLKAVINLKWLFILILLLLTAEWGLRRYNGGY